MSNWYVKELSKLTGVSVQTLHHYDKIDLLKPSLRLPNGYRVYNQRDLIRLQQIIALKFFGFELSHINKLLAGTTDAMAHFGSQIESLEAKAKALLDASSALKQLLDDNKDAVTIPWEEIIKVIEVYCMSEQLEHQWVKEIFSPDELKEYAAFEADLKSNFTSQQMSLFEEKWRILVDETQSLLDKDPVSDIGIDVGKRCIQLINGLYGKKYAHLRTKKWERGFAKGKGLKEVGLTPEAVTWLDKAIDAYWNERLYKILNQVGTKLSDEDIFHLWNEALDDMVGDNPEYKKSIYETALADEKVSKKAKEWLKGLKELMRNNNYLN
jgi:DNA-binding transcriptional MerR regulator